jgi:hypothetical protein
LRSFAVNRLWITGRDEKQREKEKNDLSHKKFGLKKVITSCAHPANFPPSSPYLQINPSRIPGRKKKSSQIPGQKGRKRRFCLNFRDNQGVLYQKTGQRNQTADPCRAGGADLSLPDSADKRRSARAGVTPNLMYTSLRRVLCMLNG